jgi:hypothetical protein
MMMTLLLKPGLLVALSTRIVGGVRYQREDIDPDHQEGDARIAEWKTRREITDAEEHERATVARNAARSAITRVCRAASSWLLCPANDEQKLADAITEARAIVDAHNRSATVTRVEVYAITGRIASTDQEAARAIGAEVRSMIDAMQRGIAAADPQAIRKAANDARQLAGMLTDDAEKKVSAAIEQARAAAREIVKRVEKAGERAADVVADLQTSKLDAARFAVLDILGETHEGVEVPVIGRAVEFDSTPTNTFSAAPLSALEF